MPTQTHTDTDTHTHSRTDTKAHSHTDTKTHTQKLKHTDIKTHRHTDTQTHRHTNTQTHRLTDTQTHRHTLREPPSRRSAQRTSSDNATIVGSLATSSLSGRRLRNVWRSLSSVHLPRTHRHTLFLGERAASQAGARVLRAHASKHTHTHTHAQKQTTSTNKQRNARAHTVRNTLANGHGGAISSQPVWIRAG